MTIARKDCRLDEERKAFPIGADGLGIIASALCMVHCVLTPVVLSLIAVWAHYLPSEERFHRILAALIATFGAVAIIGGYRRHRRCRVLLLMSVGLVLIFAGAYWGSRLPSHLAEVAVTMVGSCFMIAGHFLNHTFCRSCARCNKPVAASETTPPAR
jgi:MerC mercury resistance protein